MFKQNLAIFSTAIYLVRLSLTVSNLIKSEYKPEQPVLDIDLIIYFRPASCIISGHNLNNVLAGQLILVGAAFWRCLTKTKPIYSV